jgi:hypothetical protein
MILAWVWRYRSLKTHEAQSVIEACSYVDRDDCAFECAEVGDRIISRSEARDIYDAMIAERYETEHVSLPVVRWLWLRHPSEDRWSLHQQFTEIGKAEEAFLHWTVDLGDERVVLFSSPLHPPETRELR